MNRNEKALIKKDLNEITSSKQVILPMAIVPIVLTVLIPLALIIGVNYIGNASDIIREFGPLLNFGMGGYAKETWQWVENPWPWEL